MIIISEPLSGFRVFLFFPGFTQIFIFLIIQVFFKFLNINLKFTACFNQNEF